MSKRPILILSVALLILVLMVELPRVQAQQTIWMENFDSYPTGQNLHGVGGWKGWTNNPAFAAFTTDVQAWDAPNAIDIAANADMVHEFTVDSGLVRFSFYQYIPGNFVGTSYLALLNQYDDTVVTTNWSVQVSHNGASGLITDDGTLNSMPYVTDQWVPVCIEIDLDQNLQNYYYNNTWFYSGTWINHISGGGITSLAAVDLFANGSSSIYYDGMALTTGTCISRGVTYFLFLPAVQS